REMAADDEAAALLEVRERLWRDRAGLDVGVVDDRPGVLAARLGRLDLLHPLGQLVGDDRPDVFDGAPGGLDAGADRRLDLAHGGLQILGRGLPVWQWESLCGGCGGHPGLL